MPNHRQPKVGVEASILATTMLDTEQKSADHTLLRALLDRSTYTTADLSAQPGPDYERELVIIARLRKGMIKGDTRSEAWENAFSEAAALLRWEDEGGSLRGAQPSRKYL